MNCTGLKKNSEIYKYIFLDSVFESKIEMTSTIR